MYRCQALQLLLQLQLNLSYSQLYMQATRNLASTKNPNPKAQECKSVDCMEGVTKARLGRWRGFQLANQSQGRCKNLQISFHTGRHIQLRTGLQINQVFSLQLLVVTVHHAPYSFSQGTQAQYPADGFSYVYTV